MRALLIANVRAQTVTPGAVAVIERALSSEMKVELVRTKRQGHATHLARGATHDGADLVISFGGDGTVNEVANGLAMSDVPMGIIPGGGTNVLARSLGIPPDPVEATWHLIESCRNPVRRVPLGRAGDRYFTFTCGMGFDGAIVREVERRQLLKKTGRHGYYLWSGLRLFFAGIDRSHAPVTLRWGPDLEHRRSGLYLAITQKTSPFTYLGNRPMNVCPYAELERGLDCLAVDRFSTPFVLRLLGQVFGRARHTRFRHVLYLHDQERIEMTSDMPLPMQMDGEYLGERTSAVLESVPGALAIPY